MISSQIIKKIKNRKYIKIQLAKKSFMVHKKIAVPVI